MKTLSSSFSEDCRPAVRHLPADSLWNLQQTNDHLSQREFIGFKAGDDWISLLLYFRMGSVVEIGNLLTWPEFRKKGFMERLFNTLFKMHPQALYWLDVHEQNKSAQKLYQKLGFSINGRRKSYYRDGGDSLLLERSPEVGAPQV